MEILSQLGEETIQPNFWVIQRKQDPTEISHSRGLSSPIEYWEVMGKMFG